MNSGRVQRVDGWAVRHPYSTCPLAAGQLARLVGMSLESRRELRHRATRIRVEQCTHLLDLAGLAIAAAARPAWQRWYDISVPRRVDGRTRATLDKRR